MHGTQNDRHQHRFDETGSGIVSTGFGALVFLSFLLVAAHVLLGLYGSSVTTSVAWDEATRVATHQASVDDARDSVRRRLSGLHDLDVECFVDDEGTAVTVRVDADRPVRLPLGLRNDGLGRMHRTVHVRMEDLR